MEPRLKSIGCLLAAFAAALPAFAADYDLVIANGRVMDPETGFDKVANVGITNGTIVKISADELTGKKTVDAKGHVVAPGFIDGHVHYIDSPFGVKLGLRDGLTTPLDLEVGLFDTAEWYAFKEGKSQANYGATASLMGARQGAFDPQFVSKNGAVTNDFFSGVDFGLDYIKRVATPEEIDKILDRIDLNLKQGALGVGTTIGYMSNAVTSDELIGLRKLVAKYGRFTHDHVRFMSQSPPMSGMLATQEVVDPALVYGGGCILAHYHATSGGQMPLIEAYIDRVRSDGHPVILEIYPYNYGAAGNGVQADYLRPDNYQSAFGRTYSDIVDQLTGKPLDKETYDRMIKEDPTHPVYLYHASEELVIKGVANPNILIGSDAFPYFEKETGKQATDWDLPFDKAVGHPRGAGTRSKVLRWQREGKLGELTLMQALSKMSYLWADYLGKNGIEAMKKKGRLQEGCDADIVVFDPKTVTDNSDLPLDKNCLPSTGMPYVVVSGVVVVEDSKVLKDVFPGKPVRAPIVE